MILSPLRYDSKTGRSILSAAVSPLDLLSLYHPGLAASLADLRSIRIPRPSDRLPLYLPE